MKQFPSMNRKVLLQLFEMKGNSGDDSETEDFCLGTLFEEIEDLSEVSPNLKIQMAFAYVYTFIAFVYTLFLFVVLFRDKKIILIDIFS